MFNLRMLSTLMSSPLKTCEDFQAFGEAAMRSPWPLAIYPSMMAHTPHPEAMEEAKSLDSMASEVLECATRAGATSEAKIVARMIVRTILSRRDELIGGSLHAFRP